MMLFMVRSLPFHEVKESKEIKINRYFFLPILNIFVRRENVLYNCFHILNKILLLKYEIKYFINS